MTIFRVTFAAGCPVNPHLHDTQSDRGDHNTGDHIGEKRHQFSHQRDYQRCQYPRCNGGAENPHQADIRVGTDSQHRRHRRERHRHNHRQTDTGKFPDTDTLQQCHDTTAKQIRTDKQCHHFLAQPQPVTDNQRYRYCTGIHHQHVL